MIDWLTYSKMKRKYITPRNSGQPSNRKFKGFGFYLMSNEKLSKKNREEFLSKSYSILQRVFHSLPNDTETKMRTNLHSEMDSKLSDLELLDQWNHMYDTYGWIPREMGEGKTQRRTFIQTQFKVWISIWDWRTETKNLPIGNGSEVVEDERK